MTAPDRKSRAVEFLTRPFGDQVLLKQDRVARRQADELSAVENPARDAEPTRARSHGPRRLLDAQQHIAERLGNERSHWPTEPPVIPRHD
jgi:hypothetical protein